MDNSVCKLVDSIEGVITKENIKPKSKFRWSRLGGTVALCGGILFIAHLVHESIDLRKLEVSDEYVSYVSQIESTFNVDLPENIEGYVNRYGEILEKIDNYDNLTLNQQYHMREELVKDALFVEKSSLNFLKEVGIIEYGGDFSDSRVKFYSSYLVNNRATLDNGQREYTLNGDMKDVAEAIFDLQGWKNDDTNMYVDDWKNDCEFENFTSDIKKVIKSTAYMLKGTDLRSENFNLSEKSVKSK